MPACGRDFKCPFGIFLPFDVFEVEQRVRLRLRLPDGRGLHRRFAGQGWRTSCGTSSTP